MMKIAAADPNTVYIGPPPFVGWWNAFIETPGRDKWRFWDGVSWSLVLRPSSSIEQVGRLSGYRISTSRSRGVRWTWYYPENARVPRLPIYCVYLDENGDTIDDFSDIYNEVQK